jgi:NADPH:quinone reductase-like Zn-dependent oxidoreductase
MKALLSHAPGGPETLAIAELPDPVPGPGEILVRVRACSINYPDVLIIEDKYQMKAARLRDRSRRWARASKAGRSATA